MEFLIGNYEFEVDDGDRDLILSKKWRAVVVKTKSRDYVYGRATTGNIFLHRLVMNCFDVNYEVDHIDGDGKNNKKENLRICTTSQNQMNSRVREDNTSGHKNIHRSKSTGKWQVDIRIKKKKKYFGSFENIEDAVIRRNEVLEKEFGEFKRVE